MSQVQNVSYKPSHVWGYISGALVVIEVLVSLLLLLSKPSGAGPAWFNGYPQYLLQYVLVVLLGIGLLSSIVGVIRREQPWWLSMGGLIWTLGMMVTLSIFFRWLED